MSDETPNPGDKPVNDGGGNAPQQEPEPDTEAAIAAEKPKDDGGGSAE